MNYTLIWLPWAFDEMQEIIRASPGRRGELADILRDVRGELTRSPDTVGESRGVNKRVGFFGRLTVFFRIETADRAVYITRVHLPFDNLDAF
jgi:hypothetical protein